MCADGVFLVFVHEKHSAHALPVLSGESVASERWWGLGGHPYQGVEGECELTMKRVLIVKRVYHSFMPFCLNCLCRSATCQEHKGDGKNEDDVVFKFFHLVLCMLSACFCLPTAYR